MEIQILDWTFVVGYVLAIFAIAIFSGRQMGEKTMKKPEEIVQEKYLANKSLTFFESICSIIATEVSALTFVGIPAYAYNKDFSFIQIYMGAIGARLIIALVFLPRVYDQGLTIYEVMAKKTGLPSGQRTVALFYSLSKVVSIGVRLFSGSIMVSAFFGLSITNSLIAVCLLTLVYIQVGGLKAVVRTDILQLSLFIVGGLLAHIIIPDVSGQSWTHLMSMATAAGKTSFLNFSDPTPFLIGLAGGFLFDMCTHGVDQDFAQRLTANKNIRGGQYAIFFSSFISIAVGMLFLGVGALLWAHYQTHPYPTTIPSADYLFPHFIVNYFPVGLRGIMVAGVLAATMSVLDSTINALCATVYNDILPKRDINKIKLHSFIDSIIVAGLIFTVAVIASKNDGLLLLGLKAQSWTGGALLSLFATKVIFPKYFPYRLTTVSVIGAYICGMSGVYINTQILEWDWNLNVYWGFILGVIYLKIYSQLRPMREV